MSEVNFMTIEQIADLIAKIIRKDYYIIAGCTGLPGVGKSCFVTQLGKATARKLGTKFSYEDNITYRRSELIEWIDGKGDKREGQKPEYSVLIPDELIEMFFKRNFAKRGQKEALQLLNKCRDRHLAILGNTPFFFDLDPNARQHFGLHFYIPKRGYAYIFMRDNNPFSYDMWHQKENEKLWRKYHGNAQKLLGFIGICSYKDWQPDEKEMYYAIRNEKRRASEEDEDQTEKIPVSRAIKQRNLIVDYVYTNKILTAKQISQLTGMGVRHVNEIVAELNQ